MKTDKEFKELIVDLVVRIVLYPPLAILVGYLYKWYDYVWFNKPIHFFWLWLLSLCTMIFITKEDKIVKGIMSLVFIATLIIQILTWASVISLPIIK